MPKSKKYKTTNTTNTNYKNQVRPVSGRKNKNIMLNKSATTGNLINNFSDSIDTPKTKTHIVIGKSNYKTLLMYMDESVESFMKSKDALDIAHQSIKEAYKLLVINDVPLSKHQAYRRMKETSSEYDYILKSISNSETPQPYGLRIENHISAYFYAMLYPPIFEVCTDTSTDLMYSKYSMFLELWHNMLVQAIIVDSFCYRLHESFLALLNNKNDTVIYDLDLESDEYIFDTTNLKRKKDVNNFKDYFLELYDPSINFACHVKEKAFNERKPQNKGEKSIKSMIEFPFFQSGNRGIKMNNYINSCISTLTNLQKCLSEDYKKYKSNKFLRLYRLYNFQKQLHMFDFIWHSEFYKVNFHLTNGFVTNYVLYFILKQNKELISLIFNDENNKHKDESVCPIDCGKSKIYDFGIAYTSPNSTELSIENTLENYDLEFINSLIKRASITIAEYPFNHENNQSHYLWEFASNNMIFPIIDKFLDYADSLFNESFVHNFSDIWNDSTDYYKQIYEDTHFDFEI